jgi:hypothetical protein
MATPSFWKDHKPHYWLWFACLDIILISTWDARTFDQDAAGIFLDLRSLLLACLQEWSREGKGRSITSLLIPHEQPPKISEWRTVKKKP